MPSLVRRETKKPAHIAERERPFIVLGHDPAISVRIELALEWYPTATEASQILLRLFEHAGSHFPAACYRWIRVCRIHIIAQRLYLPSLPADISEKLGIFCGEERRYHERRLADWLPRASVTNRRRILQERFESWTLRKGSK